MFYFERKSKVKPFPLCFICSLLVFLISYTNKHKAVSYLKVFVASTRFSSVRKLKVADSRHPFIICLIAAVRRSEVRGHSKPGGERRTPTAWSSERRGGPMPNPQCFRLTGRNFVLLVERLTNVVFEGLPGKSPHPLLPDGSAPSPDLQADGKFFQAETRNKKLLFSELWPSRDQGVTYLFRWFSA